MKRKVYAINCSSNYRCGTLFWMSKEGFWNVKLLVFDPIYLIIMQGESLGCFRVMSLFNFQGLVWIIVCFAKLM